MIKLSKLQEVQTWVATKGMSKSDYQQLPHTACKLWRSANDIKARRDNWAKLFSALISLKFSHRASKYIQLYLYTHQKFYFILET